MMLHAAPDEIRREAVDDAFADIGKAQGAIRILETDAAPPERIHDLGEKNLHVHQTFDIGTDAARTLLAQAIGRVEDEHAGVSRAMADFFLAHCSLEALLHPSSV